MDYMVMLHLMTKCWIPGALMDEFYKSSTAGAASTEALLLLLLTVLTSLTQHKANGRVCFLLPRWAVAKECVCACVTKSSGRNAGWTIY